MEHTLATSGIELDVFLASLGQEIRLLHQASKGPHGSRVRWVEPSELTDPTPYLLPGEVVLTAGMIFTDTSTDDEVTQYVRRLVQAQVCAIGFGLTPYHDSTPAPLLNACRDLDLTLIEIPAHIPFAAIGMQFARQLESERAASLAAIQTNHRKQLAAAVSSQPETELLRLITTRTRGWAYLCDVDGTPRIRSGRGRQPDDAITTVHDTALAGQSSTSSTSDGWQVYGHPLRGANGALLGALVLGAPEALDPLVDEAVRSTVAMAEILYQQRTSGAMAPGQLACTLALNASSTDITQPAVERLILDSLSAGSGRSMRVVYGLAPRGSRHLRDDLLYWRQLFGSMLIELTPDGFRAITRQQVDDEFFAHAHEQGWRFVGVACPNAHDLPDAARRAAALTSRVRRTGRSLYGDQTELTLSQLIEPDAGRALAADLLGPLLHPDADENPSRLAVFRDWLEANGNWEMAARTTGLHRNSLRRIIDQVQTVLGLDLNSAQVRAQLVIALTFVEI